jgi:hypothetical protein
MNFAPRRGNDGNQGERQVIGIATSVMAGLDPAIHKAIDFASLDSRLKGGYDNEG